MNTESANVARHLVRMASEHPQRPALHWPAKRVEPTGPSPHHTLTFAELNAESDALAHGLGQAGITRGTRTVVMVPPSPEFFVLTYALLKAAAIPVLIDPGMGLRKIGPCLADAEPQAFIGIPKAQLIRVLMRWGKPTLKVRVNVGRSRFFSEHTLNELKDRGRSRGMFPVVEATPSRPAAILFTSGSTGVAKGAEYTHGIFSAQVDLLRETYGIEPGEVDLCTFPLFALFGPALGMTCVIPDMNASRPARMAPAKAVAQIQQFSVTNLFGSPAVIRRLGEHGVALPTLRRAISAGAPASMPMIEAFARLLPPGVELHTPYGATEALPVTDIGSKEILAETRQLTEHGRGVCVGRPVAGVNVSIIRITDTPIPEWDASLLAPPGEVGEIVVRGPIVTRLYYRRPEATKLAKMTDPATGEVLHRMGDVGYLDEQGRLWFCGRKSHRVATPTATLFTDMVEPIFNTLQPQIGRTALVGVTRQGITYPVLCVERGTATWEVTLEQLRTLAQRFPHTAAITTFLLYPRSGGFPVDIRHNSKIFREQLARWADGRLGPQWKPEVAS